MVMKLSRVLILAGALITNVVMAQSEQWLEYHTGGEGLAYHSMELTTNPPPNITVPKTISQPYFARWVTPMDPSGGRWFCLDRTRKSGPYDRIYFDTTGNGRLDDKKVGDARLESNFAYFPGTRVIFKGEDGPITYHVMFRYYQYEKSPPQLLAMSVGWYEGMVKFEGVKKHIKLIDGNVNGTFNDMAENPYDSDRIQIDGDKVGERFLGKMLEVDGKFYRIEAARDGAFVKIQKAENVVLGAVHTPENISEFSAFGENGHFVRKPVKGEFTLPTGKYRMVGWEIKRNDDKGAAWSLKGYNFPDTANFEVVADKASELVIGEPVKAELKANEGENRQVNFSLSFVGQQKESIELLRGNERPRGPKLMLATANGALAYTNTFEFG